MNWQHFQTYNEAPTRAFEALCNQLFEQYCKHELADEVEYFSVVNGSGGDGGIEAYTILKSGDIIGLQAKWFTESITDNQFLQIKNSIETAIKIRPKIKKYIVCIPRDLASVKLGRGKKVIKNSEDARWDNIKSELKKSNPDLEIILWNDSELLNQLQKSESSGIYRYWFEKSELDIDTLKYSFAIQKSGWLNLKYIPEIHSKGIIDLNIKNSIGTLGTRISAVKKLNAFKHSYTKLLELVKEYIKFGHLSDKLMELIKPLNKKSIYNIIQIERFIEKLTLENINKSLKINIEYIDFNDFMEELCKINSASSDFINKFNNAISNINNSDGLNTIEKIQSDIVNHLLLFMGNPGTGKTHGIVNAVETILEDSHHAAILIQAKSISTDDRWKDILIKGLGLSNEWSETELWQALEALSHRLECKQAVAAENNELPYIIPKILICIDGLDELRPFDFWIERLRETSAISANYPRIRFCVSSRPCALKELTWNDEILQNKVYLNDDGDVPVHKLFNNYLEKYNIQVKDCNWLKWSLKTPLALRLFCEIHKGQSISNISSSSTTISKLIEKKIQIMDMEFRKFCGNYTENDYILNKSISILGDCFLDNSEILKGDLLQLLKNSPDLKFILEPDYIKIIEYLENYGFIQSYVHKPKGLLAQPQTYYETGIQPFFDYILAIILFKKNPNPKEINSIEAIKDNYGALQMFSILLLENHNIPIADIDCFKKNLLNHELTDLNWFGLINIPAKQAKDYIPRTKKFMSQNAECLMEVVNNVILPVSRINNHPLGPMLLHEYLISFNLPAKRDLMWSTQFWLSSSGDEIWSCGESINLNSYELTDEDMFDGLPLLYAWLLTNIDNTKRASYRKELMKWALIKPREYCKLFDIAFKTNDPQMKEDLLGIGMGLALSVDFKDDTLKFFSDFVITEIFEPKKIRLIKDITIRYYGRAIAERAYQANLITKETLNCCIPPFKTTSDEIPMAKKAVKGTRMSGYRPITYDLARYVLCDTIEHTFFDKRTTYDYEDKEPVYSNYFKKEEIDTILKKHLNLKAKYRSKLIEAREYLRERELSLQKMSISFENDFDNKKLEDLLLKKVAKEKKDFYSHYNEEAKTFLMAQAKELELEALRPDQFVLAAAYAYIKELGWNEEEFDGNNGVDNAIKGYHSPASHGSQSKIMTFCEKYIWCFKNEIYGYLMDRLDPKNDYGIDNINDYSLITTNIINPIQELYQQNPEETMANNDWFVPESLSPAIDGLTATKEGISNWIKNAPVPDFSKWININYIGFKEYDNNWVVLDSFNKIDEPNVGAESILWISSGIINKDYFEYLKNDLYLKRNYICGRLNNPTDFNSSTITDCYITPKEVCQMQWKKETSSLVKTYTIIDDSIKSYQIIKAVEKCVSGYPEHGEIYYKLPSKYIRQTLGIVDGDGLLYYDDNKKTQAISFEAGENWKEQQSTLCVNKDKLINKLKEKEQTIFWLCRLLREPSNRASKKYKDFYARNDRTWIVWFENDECKSLCFSEEYSQSANR